MLVTHQTQFLPLADQIVIMEHGAVVHLGSYAQLSEAGVDLEQPLSHRVAASIT